MLQGNLELGPIQDWVVNTDTKGYNKSKSDKFNCLLDSHDTFLKQKFYHW